MFELDPNQTTTFVGALASAWKKSSLPEAPFFNVRIAAARRKGVVGGGV